MDAWTELYDPKNGRQFRQIPYYGLCKICNGRNGHHLDCPEVTLESLGKLVKVAQAAEEHARQRADRYWKMIQQYQGKLAVLRHENNKLRKANAKIESK